MGLGSSSIAECAYPGCQERKKKTGYVAEIVSDSPKPIEELNAWWKQYNFTTHKNTYLACNDCIEKIPPYHRSMFIKKSSPK